MYLLLVENNFISSRELKVLLDKNKISCEIINSLSSKALLDIAKKLAPDIVIIDLDFYVDDSAELIRKLREYSNEAYILAFIDPDHHEKLHLAIEMGIDDYMIKPLQRDDVMLRIKMGLQRKSTQLIQPVENKQTAIENEIKHADLEEVSYRYNKEITVEPEYCEKVEINREEAGENKYSRDQIYADLSDQSGEPAQEDEYELKDTPAMSFLEAQSPTEISEKEGELTFEEYDSQEELFTVKTEPEQGQTDINDTGAVPEAENEIAFADDNDLQDAPEFEYGYENSEEELITGEDENGYRIADQDTDADYQSLASYFNQSSGAAETEVPVSAAEEEEVTVPESAETELQQDPDLLQENNEWTDPEISEVSETELAEAELNESHPVESENLQEPDPVEENDAYLFGVSAEDPEDKELFGMKQAQRTADTSSFEELFANNDNFEAKQSRQPDIQEIAKHSTPQKKHFFFFNKNQRASGTGPQKEDENSGLTAEQGNTDFSKRTKKSRLAKAAGIFTISIFLLLVTLSIYLIQSGGYGGG